MTSIVSLCNSALMKIGGERITDLSENSKSAIVCNEQYDKILNLVLRSHPWNFAITRQTLAALSSTPVFDYAYAYQLPNDCLRVLNVQDPSIEFKIEGRQLITDEPVIQIKYVFKNIDPTQYDPAFCEAFSARLAAELAYVITQNVALSQNLYGLYKELLTQARTMDAQEGTPEAIIVDDWLTSRY
jgi:hypothetical protein